MNRPKLRFESSWDDGAELDLKVVQLLKQYKLPGIFYLTTRCPMFYEIPMLVKNKFEVGGHTMTHPMDMKELDVDEIDWEIGSNKKLLQLEGAEVTKFCYPRGRYDQRVIDCLKHYKFRQARTTKVLSIKTDDPFRTDTTIHIFPRQEYNGKHWLDMAKEYTAKASMESGEFRIWGHSWEVEKFKEWENLEAFFKWLNKNFEVCTLN